MMANTAAENGTQDIMNVDCSATRPSISNGSSSTGSTTFSEQNGLDDTTITSGELIKVIVDQVKPSVEAQQDIDASPVRDEHPHQWTGVQTVNETISYSGTQWPCSLPDLMATTGARGKDLQAGDICHDTSRTAEAFFPEPVHHLRGPDDNSGQINSLDGEFGENFQALFEASGGSGQEVSGVVQNSVLDGCQGNVDFWGRQQD